MDKLEITARFLANFIHFENENYEDKRWVDLHWHRYKEDAKQLLDALGEVTTGTVEYKLEDLEFHVGELWTTGDHLRHQYNRLIVELDVVNPSDKKAGLFVKFIQPYSENTKPKYCTRRQMRAWVWQTKATLTK